jgi:outer membrane protein OmpA-like peptidoglycan-associated protein
MSKPSLRAPPRNLLPALFAACLVGFAGLSACATTPAPLPRSQQHAYMQRLAARLRSAAEGTDIEVTEERDDGLRLRIPAHTAFRIDSTQLQETILPPLDAIGTALARAPRTLVEVVGYSDSIGPADFNAQFSRGRADSITDRLLKRGVSVARLTTRGAGETVPLSPNDTIEGRQRNRRVELLITPLTRANLVAPVPAPVPLTPGPATSGGASAPARSP